MITCGNYEPMEITLNWDGQVVGYIDIIGEPPRPGMSHVSSLSTLPFDASGGQSTTSNSNANITLPAPLSRSQPDLRFTSYDAPMARSTVVLIILKTLVTLAPNDEWDLVQAFQVSAPPSFEATLKLQPLSNPPSGAQPFEWIYVFHILQLIARNGLLHGQ